MPKLIYDEFTSLDISPQVRYQRRRAAAGRCRLCGAPATSGQLCAKHREYASSASKGRIPFIPKLVEQAESLAKDPPPPLEEII